jgi:hypothetical protein
MENFAREAGSESRPLVVYGGVARSVETVKLKAQADGAEAALLPYYAVDIGLSAVGDTLTLPVTAPMACVRYAIVFLAACRGEI